MDEVTKTPQANKIDWVRLAVTIILFVIFSLAIAYIVHRLLIRFHLPIYEYEIFTYLVIFAISLVINLSFIPLPFAISIMVAAAASLSPVWVALAGSVGACIGESSAYYAGRLGKRLAIPDSLVGYQRIEGWVKKYGSWAIALLSFQPIIPIEIGGLIAGLLKMPFYKFFPALLLGKFPKYLIIIVIGAGIIHGFNFRL